MLQLQFTIDNHYLITHTLAKSTSFSTDTQPEAVVAFSQHAWELSQPCFRLLTGRLAPHLFFATTSLAQLLDYLTQLEQSLAFRLVRDQTEAFATLVQAQWEHNYPLTSQAIQEMTGFALHKTMLVRLTHPGLCNGSYLGNDLIAWGHQEEWPHYATVYLWHEILHSYFPLDELSHALIQLIAENELRTRLQATISYPPFVGHEDLFALMEKILPHWRSYLTAVQTSGKGDILAFQATLAQHLREHADE